MHSFNKLLVMIPLLLLAALISSAAYMQQDQKKDDKQAAPAKEAPKDKSKDQPGDKKAGDQPKPLFEGKLGVKSSRQTKDSAGLGFNGLDPEGKIEKAALESSPTEEDAVRAKALASLKPTDSELKQFLDEGHLTAPPPPAAASTGGDKSNEKDKDAKKKDK